MSVVLSSDSAALSTERWVYQPDAQTKIPYVARHHASMDHQGLRFTVTVRQPYGSEDANHGCKLVVNVYKTWRQLFLEFRAGRLNWAAIGAFEKHLPKSLSSDASPDRRRDFFRSALLFEAEYSPTLARRDVAKGLLDRISKP